MKMTIIGEEDFARLGKSEREIELMKLKRQQEVVRTIYHDSSEFIERYVEIHTRLTEAEVKNASK